MTDLRTVQRLWKPLPETSADDLHPWPAAALAATLDESPPLIAIPPLWHWVYFLDWVPTAELGTDGHPRSGHLPPIENRTRMFVGGRFTIEKPIAIGVPAQRLTSVVDTSVKDGRTGQMLFVTVRHEIWQQGELVVTDEQDLMYRSGSAQRQLEASGPINARVRSKGWVFVADEVLLFRFSALTANAHRIHYDHRYVTEVEQYPGLVVHGPLIALLMAKFVSGFAPTGSTLATFDYRFVRPCFAGDEIVFVGGSIVDGTDVRAIVGDDQTVAQAHATFRPLD
jgi:hydroxyacyl-ACP dehydratase HTD2-like protein with hotdog domain